MPDGWKLDETTGEAKLQRRTIGYYPDKKSAMLALAEYNRLPAALGTASLTFSDIFEMWKAEHYKTISPKTIPGWDNAFKNSKPLHKLKMKDIRAQELNACMEAQTVGAGSQARIRSFWNQIFLYAIEHDIVQKNYAQFVTEKDRQEGTKKRPFSDSEVRLLWSNAGALPGVDAVLIMIYTGMRPTELLEMRAENVRLQEQYMIGGIKTKAGKDRIIPICSKILPLVERCLSDGAETLIAHKGGQMEYFQFRRQLFRKLMTQLQMEHTAHECRHTAVSAMRSVGMDKHLVKMIVGHSAGDVTDRYTHIKPAQLVAEIEKLNGWL